MAIDQVKKIPLYEIAYENIKASILSGDLKSGSALNQSELAVKMGISRMPIRDALRILEKENLIVYNKNQGYIVADFPEAKIMDTLLVRSIIEPRAVLLSRNKITDREIGILENLVSAAATALNIRNFQAVRQFNHDFHYTIYQCVGSAILMSIVENLWNSYPKYLFQVEEEAKNRSIQEHAEIIRCMKNDAFERAAELMEQHILEAVSITK